MIMDFESSDEKQIKEIDKQVRALALPQSVNQVTSHIDLIQNVVEQVMVRDVHYGIIPGTTKLSLLKAGAEILLTTFQIAIIPVVLDKSGKDEARYLVTCKGVHMQSGRVIGEGIGECTSFEEKHYWKKCSQREYDRTAEDYRRIKYSHWYENGNLIEREDLQVRNGTHHDKVNTVLKIAKKRAMVDLAHSCLALGNLFASKDGELPTQNDKPGNYRQNSYQQKPKQKTQNQQPRGKITTGQLGLIRGKLGIVSEDDLVLNFKVENLEALNMDVVNEVLDWIKEKNKEAMS